MKILLIPQEVDEAFRWPRGRAAKLAREGKLRSITLPDGAIRFSIDDLASFLNGAQTSASPAEPAASSTANSRTENV